MDQSDENITAAFLVIGDEILSGRTKDKNIGVLADFLTQNAIELCEVRIVKDHEEAIVAAVNALRKNHTYVFTSGGIGPTHDDITAPTIAKALGRPCIEDPRAIEILADHYRGKQLEFTKARRRMTRMPEGAELIPNPISKAPGFIIENIHVMAGVPQIFQAMLQNLEGKLQTGTRILSKTINSPHPEGQIGTALGKIQSQHPQVSIGSYPHYEENGFSNQIVIRSKDENRIQAALNDIKLMLASIDS